MAEGLGPLSHEHLSVDGTMLDAWASRMSVQPKDLFALTARKDDIKKK